MNWGECKAAFEAKMNHDPQRATLAVKAIAGVEEGLRHLRSVGWNFEIAPLGTLKELVESKVAPGAAPAGTRTLSIAEGSAIVAAPKQQADNSLQAKAS